MPRRGPLCVAAGGIPLVVAAGCALILPSCGGGERTNYSLPAHFPVLVGLSVPAPAHKMIRIQNFLPQVRTDPNLPPPGVVEGTPLALFEVKITGHEKVEKAGVLRGVQGASLRHRAALFRAGRRTEPADYLVVVTTKKKDQVLYWVWVSDPTRVFVETVVDQSTGELQGRMVKVPEGLLTAFVPFVVEGKVLLFRGKGGAPLQPEEPLATAAFGKAPPSPSSSGVP